MDYYYFPDFYFLFLSSNSKDTIHAIINQKLFLHKRKIFLSSFLKNKQFL